MNDTFSPSERIQLILEQEKLNQAGLCRVTGLKSAKVSQLKTGKSKQLTLDVAKAINEALPKYPIEWLITGEGDPFDQPPRHPIVKELEQTLANLQEQVRKVEALLLEK